MTRSHLPRSFEAAACAALFTVSALTGCASAGSGSEVKAPATTIVIDSASLYAIAQSGDSAGLAGHVRTTCASAADKPACYESLLAIPAARGRVKVAMGALSQLAARDADIRRSGHVYAHAIGIAAGKGRRDVASAFSECSESFQSGCYHGVIQAYFAGLDSISAADANALCAPFRRNEADKWLRFQCVHGMGHGLTMLYDHDLPKGLAGCDLLTEWWDRHSCYSGAFMENIVNVTMPHHPASALAHHDGKAEEMPGMDDHDMSDMGHDMSGMAHGSGPKFKPIDPSDQQYPCSKMGERYLSACYEMQTSVMLYNNKGDIAGAAKECDKAPVAMRAICYASLGRDISSYSQQKHSEAIRMCSLGTPKYQPYCYYGLVKNFIDLDARPSDGIAMCRDVPGSANKAVCYNAVGEQILALTASVDSRRALCSSAEAEYVDACFYGARIEGVRAPEVLQEVWASVRQ